MDNDRFYLLAGKKLAFEATAEEMAELEEILRLNPDLHYSLEALYAMWQKPSETPAALAEASFEKHIQRMQEQLPDFIPRHHETVHELIESPGYRHWKWINASLVSLVLLITLYWITHPSPKIVSSPADPKESRSGEIVTQFGTRTKLLLPDGTTVWLNAGSKLKYDSSYNTNLREVSLTGEAYFDVVKNKAKPFLIHAGTINIRVLGTAFDIKAYPDEKTIEASLLRGKIEVTFPTMPFQKIFLYPNEKLVIKRNVIIPNTVKGNTSIDRRSILSIQRLTKIGSDSVIAETGWIQNKLFFNDLSFVDLLKIMQRKYGVNFEVSDSSMDTIHFTGSFDSENIQQALNALRMSAPFNYTILNKNIQITTK